MNEGRGRGGILADQEHIHCAEIEVVKERESSKALVRRVLSGIKLWRLSAGFLQWREYLEAEHTMTVFPLYCMIWHDRPTSLPPPRQRNLRTSEGSTGSSGGAAAIAAAFRLEAMSGGRCDEKGQSVVATRT